MKSTSLKSLFLRVLLVLALGMGINSFIAPQASACCGDGAVASMGIFASAASKISAEAGQWVQQFENWAQQFTFLVNIINMIKLFTDTFNKGIAQLGSLLNVGQRLQSMADVRIAQGLATAYDQSQGAAATAIVAGQHAPPSPENQALCALIKIGMGPVAAASGAAQLGIAIHTLITDPYYTGGKIGNGVRAAAAHHAMVCGSVTGVKMGDPAMGYDSDCVNSNPELTNAYMNSSTLNGMQVFEWPNLSSVSLPKPGGGTISGYSLDATTDPQKWFIAGISYCQTLAGPIPPPPADTDKALLMNHRATYDRALAFRNTFIEACEDRIRELTRFNCKDPLQAADPTVKAVCQQTQEQCKNFVALGGALPPGVDCDSGLSGYQSELIKHLACSQPKYYVSMANGGGTQDIAEAIADCGAAMTVWKATEQQKMANLANAAEGLQLIASDFADAQTEPPSGKRVSFDGLDKISLKAYSESSFNVDEARVFYLKAVTSIAQKMGVVPLGPHFGGEVQTSDMSKTGKMANGQ